MVGTRAQMDGKPQPADGTRVPMDGKRGGLEEKPGLKCLKLEHGKGWPAAKTGTPQGARTGLGLERKRGKRIKRNDVQLQKDERHGSLLFLSLHLGRNTIE
jgi:hypothetical protein